MADTIDEGDSRVPDLRDRGRTLWRHRRIIAVTVVVVVGAAIGLSLMQTKVYQTTADIIIQPTGPDQILNPSQSDAQSSARDIAKETAVLRSRVMSDAARQKLGHDPSISISSSDATSDVVSITAQSSDPAVAAKDANGYAAAYVAFRRGQTIDSLFRAGQQIQASLHALDTRIATLAPGSPALAAAQLQQSGLQQELVQIQTATNLNQLGGARIISAAGVPGSPVSPKPKHNAELALILGLLLGIGLAFLREFLDDKIESRDDLELATSGLPVLGQIQSVDASRKATNELVTLNPSPTEEAASEAYRTLRTSIQFLSLDQSLRTIQVTSAESGEGKSVTVANLAIAFARAGRQVAIICCDLRRPRVHEFFGLGNKIGFTSVVLGECTAIEALQLVPTEPNLAILAAGPAAPNPSELLSSNRAWETISAIAERADVVFVDTPPVLPVSDALVVSGMADATIVVASAGATTRRSLKRAMGLLHQVEAPLVGSVLNNAEPVSATGYAPYAPVETNGNGSSRRRVPDAKHTGAR